MLLRVIGRLLLSLRTTLSFPRTTLSFPRAFLSFPRAFLSFPRRRESTIKTLTILFLLFTPNLSCAKGKELDAIIINADDVVIDKKTSSSIFTGHVILWFDNGLIIETDKVILTIKEANNKKSLDRIIMPSKLRAIRDGEGIATTPSEATLIAEEAEYIEEKSELRLKGDVYIRDNDNFVKCNELVYYTNVKKLSTNGR